MRFIFTMSEKFRRDDFDRYCTECGKQFEPRRGLTLWCGRRCQKRTAKRAEAPAPGVGRIYHRPFEG